MPKRVAIGIVTSQKMAKTRVVEIPRLVKHAKYGKYLRQRTVCYVHDEDEQSGAGDTVEIMESRPRSKTKRWELVRVIEKSRLAARVELAGEALDAPPAVTEGAPADHAPAGE
jgi:small subunit ribosomal protein S17